MSFIPLSQYSKTKSCFSIHHMTTHWTDTRFHIFTHCNNFSTFLAHCSTYKWKFWGESTIGHFLLCLHLCCIIPSNLESHNTMSHWARCQHIHPIISFCRQFKCKNWHFTAQWSNQWAQRTTSRILLGSWESQLLNDVLYVWCGGSCGISMTTKVEYTLPCGFFVQVAWSYLDFYRGSMHNWSPTLAQIWHNKIATTLIPFFLHQKTSCGNLFLKRKLVTNWFGIIASIQNPPC